MSIRTYRRGVVAHRHVAPWTPLSDAATAGYWNSSTLADGAVSSWASTAPSQITVTQATGSAQPTKGATGVVWDGNDNLARGSSQIARFLSATTLPDGTNSTAGKGPTCTGLALAANGTWWVANHGQQQPADVVWTPSLVNYSADFSTKLSEIQLAPLFPGIQSVQGVVYDTSDDTLWVADVTGTKIRHLTLAGADAGGEITPSFSPNGIARDAADNMWIWQEESAGHSLEKRSCADGTVVTAAVTLSLGNDDQLFMDDTNKVLFCSYGANGSPGNVAMYSTANATLRAIGTITLPAEVDAIEGIYIVGNRMYVTNDGYFHSGTPALNRVITLEVAPPCTNIAEIWGVWTVPTTTGTDGLFQVGDALANANNGFGLYSAGATDLRLFAHSGGTGTTTQATITGVSPSMASARIIYAQVNHNTNLMTLWVDGTQIQQGSCAVLDGALSASGTVSFGGNIAAGRAPTQTVPIGGYNMGAGDRQKYEGFMAHQRSLTANLPSDHPYKTVAP